MNQLPFFPQQFRYLYVHLPFCDVICHYCDFYTARNRDSDHERLFLSLESQLRKNLVFLAPKLNTIYFGGGTPGASPPYLVHKFLNLLRDHIDQNTEITLEANPNNLSNENLVAWKDAGINRLSVGVQSLNPQILKSLSRTHSAEQALVGISEARKLFPTVCADLMYAIPQQNIEEPSTHLLKLMEAGANHISAYHLTLRPKHFMLPKQPDDHFAFSQMQCLIDTAAGKNFEHYEITAFAPRGKESKHNSSYWNGNAYFALGPSAHGFDGKNFRWFNVKNWQEYCSRSEKGETAIESSEFLTREQLYIEKLFTRLRTREGLNINEINQSFGLDFEAFHAHVLKELLAGGFAHLEGGFFRLSFKGKMLADPIVSKLSSLP